MAVSPSPNDLTRQQLDELDTLLQRMLALPISQPEPAVAYPPPPPLPDLPPRPTPRLPEPTITSWRADTPTAPSSKSPHLTPAPEPTVAFTPTVLPFPPGGRTTPDRPAADLPPPRLFAPPPEPAAPEPFVAPGTLRGVDAPALPFFHPAEEPPTTAPTPAADFPEVNPFAESFPPIAPPPEPTTTHSVPVFLWPVFALNWVMEFALGWFGPIGHLLTRPLAKTLLGWSGVLLLLAAGVWAARGMGWVSWPGGGGRL
ncbi:MAG: hypothetical protein MUF18_04580 [Fimbriiglobus sp.]|nr:hypothetical protein [Fimbriiglobus sp.]